MTAGGGLTPDLIARAVISAAKVFGEDPVKAMTPGRGHSRWAASAAGVALVEVAGLTRLRAARIVGVDSTSLTRARARGGERFQVGLTAVAAIYRAGGVAAGAPVRRGRRPKVRVAAPAPEPAPPVAKVKVAIGDLPPEDAAHLRGVMASNRSRGFPALVERASK